MEKKEKKGKREKANTMQMLAAAILTGAALSAGISIVLIFLCAVAISAGVLGMERSGQLTIAVCAIGGIIGGLVAVRRAGCRALPVGLGSGIAFFFILMVVGLLVLENAAPGTAQLPLFFVCLCSGGLAGLTGKKRKKRRT